MKSIGNNLKSEQQFQQTYENQQQLMKSFQASFTAGKEVLKKFGSAVCDFAQNLDEISKLNQQQSEQPLGTLLARFSLILKEISVPIKLLGSSIVGASAYLKDQKKAISCFREDCKNSFNDHVKLYNQIKKEYDQSADKLDAIQSKMEVYAKSVCPLQTKESQQFQFLKHQEQMAKNERKIRLQNKRDYQIQMSQFIDEQAVQVSRLFSKYTQLTQNSLDKSLSAFNSTFNQLAKADRLADCDNSQASNRSAVSGQPMLARSKSPLVRLKTNNVSHQGSTRSRSPMESRNQQILNSEYLDSNSNGTCQTARVEKLKQLPFSRIEQNSRDTSSFFSDKLLTTLRTRQNDYI